jgi:hypothetical protein
MPTRFAKDKPMPQIVTAILVLAALAPPAHADNPPEPEAQNIDIAQTLYDLAARQARLRVDFNDFKGALLAYSQRLEASPRPEDRGRAPLLKRAAEKAKEDAIDKGFEKLAATLKAIKTDDRAGVEKAMAEANDQGKRLRGVLDLLPRLPILMIDGGGDQPGDARKDSYYLKNLFESAKAGYRVVSKAEDDLDALDLTTGRYSCVYLLNVASPGEKGAKRLESYVRGGGQVAIFLGDRVRPAEYNKLLYAKGRGLFPVPLVEKKPERISAEEKFRRIFEDRPQILFRDERHPIFKNVAGRSFQPVFNFLSVEAYWPAQERSEWKADPTEVHELVTLPNRGPADNYRDAINKVREGLAAAAKEDKYEKYRPALERHKKRLTTAIGEGTLPSLAGALDLMLNDRGDLRNRGTKPDLKPFWEKNDALRAKAARLRDAVLYGDPLVLTREFGKGETVVFLTTAGKAWNDWAGGGMASPTYPVVMLNLHQYLTCTGEEKVIDDLLDIEAAEEQQILMLIRIKQQLIRKPLAAHQPAAPARAALALRAGCKAAD